MKRRILTIKFITLFVIATAMFSHHKYDQGSFMDLVLEGVGYVAMIVAAMGRVWASAYISGNKDHALVTDGPYSITRNPLYFFSFVGFVGVGLAFESLVIAGGMAGVFFVTHWVTILNEEKKLRQLFGDQYDLYAQTVPRFVPNPWKMINPPHVTFSPAVFSKAVLECSLIALAFGLIQLVELAQTSSMIPTLFRIY